MRNLLEKLFPTVSEKVYERFVATGEVADSVLEYLAVKVMTQKQLTSYEQAIFTWKTDKINEIIVKKAQIQDEKG